jgi:protein gp37
MKNSHIEWTDHTFNPWEGCTKVSPGCAHCYAEARNQRFSGGANWGKGAPRRRTSEANWRQPIAWDKASAFASEHGVRRSRVFCASLADWLDDEVPIEWLVDLLDLIRRTPNLDWLLLTKRPQNWRDRICRALAHVEGIDFETGDSWEGDAQTELGIWLNDWTATDGTGIPDNIWIGTTVEDQQRADERIPLLLQIPAKVRFLSCEPLLGPVDVLSGWAIRGKVDWVICGGESGHGARPMHPDWARSLRDQCAAAGVPFFFKQWGEWLPGCQYREGDKDRLKEKSQHSFDADNHSWWVGKLASGRLLDGQEHSAFPSPHVATR